MPNKSFKDQVELCKRTARQSGISGVVYIDFNPADGFLRLKLKVIPPESQSMLTSKFAEILAQVSQWLGLQAKVHQDDGGKVGAKL